MNPNFWFLIGLLALLVIWDFARFFSGGIPATISWWLYTWFQKMPWLSYAFVFALGALAWHLIGGKCL